MGSEGHYFFPFPYAINIPISPLSLISIGIFGQGEGVQCPILQTCRKNYIEHHSIGFPI